MIKIILLAYLLLINIITYFTYAADKTKARQNKWRIPERTIHPVTFLLIPRRPPRHETLPPQNPPPEIQIRNPYYSNHSNNNHIFSLPQYLKYLIPQHSRLTGAVRPLYPKHNTKRNSPPRGAAPPLYNFPSPIFAAAPSPFHNPSNFATASAQAARPSGWLGIR